MPGIRNALVTLALLSLLPLRATAEADDLDSLEFMVGAWASEKTIVEYWLPPLRGLMVGINREPQGEGMPFFEYLRIEAREDGVFYVASPRGRGTTDFKLTESSESKAVFENPDHDFPKKIAYTRTGDRLEVEVGGNREGRPWSSFTQSWELAP